MTIYKEKEHNTLIANINVLMNSKNNEGNGYNLNLDTLLISHQSHVSYRRPF